MLAISDALWHFIPVFGKGMSVAAQEAVILDRLLAEDVPMKRLARDFFAAIQGAIAKLLGAQSWFSVRRRYHDQLNRVVTFVRTANSQRGSPIVTGRFTPSAG